MQSSSGGSGMDEGQGAEVPLGPDIRPFRCAKCSKHFTRRENLKRHVRSVHRSKDTRLFQCSQCNVSFSRDDLRKRHINKHHSSTHDVDHPSLHISVQASDFHPAEGLDDVLGDYEFPTMHDSPIPWLLIPPNVATYFEKFHQTMPALHQPTFEVIAAETPLLQAVACLGAVYNSPDPDFVISKAFFDSGYEFLNKYVEKDPLRYREVWVIQAFLLFEIFAMYSCNDGLFLIAQNIHRKLIDGVRSVSLLQNAEFNHKKDTGWLEDDDTILNHESPTMRHGEGSIADQWHIFIKNEAQKRIIYGLYYVDSQMAVCCNIKPLISAMEIKYELPCRDHFWAAPTAEEWDSLRQEEFSSFNEEDDSNGNPDPRPGQGFLYESMMHLIHRERGQQFRLLWYSPFATLMLTIQIQMMARELTSASIFLYSNIGTDATRHNLTILAEEHRGPIVHALMNLADLIPKTSSMKNKSDHPEEYPPNTILWHSVWIAWHYTALSLTHQDSLLTTGIVECNIPAAISTAWELGRPRAKSHRDIYDDQDVFRIVNSLEQILIDMTDPPQTEAPSEGDTQCIEDPFITMVGFKSFMIGWRIVRLMMLNIDQGTRRLHHSGLYEAPTQSVLSRIMAAIKSFRSETVFGEQSSDIDVLDGKGYELRYLEWGDKVFTQRKTWPIGSWMTIVLKEALDAL